MQPTYGYWLLKRNYKLQGPDQLLAASPVAVEYASTVDIAQPLYYATMVQPLHNHYAITRGAFASSYVRFRAFAGLCTLEEWRLVVDVRAKGRYRRGVHSLARTVQQRDWQVATHSQCVRLRRRLCRVRRAAMILTSGYRRH